MPGIRTYSYRALRDRALQIQRACLTRQPFAIGFTHARKRLSRQIGQLATRSDIPFADGWNKLVAETEATFRREESAMEHGGYAGLAMRRRASNARTLSALHHVTACVEKGEISAGRAALSALAVIVATPNYIAETYGT